MQLRLSSVGRHLKLESSALVVAAKKAGFVSAHSDSLFEGKELKQILVKHGLGKKQVEAMLADDRFHAGVTIEDLGDDFDPSEQVVLGSTRFHFNPDRPITNPYHDEESLEHAEEMHSVSEGSLYSDLADDTQNLSALEVLQMALHKEPKERARCYQTLADKEVREAKLCDKRKEVNEAAKHRIKAVQFRRMARDLQFLVEEQEEAEALKQALPNLSGAQRSRVQGKLMVLDQVWLPIVPDMAEVDLVVLRTKALKSIKALAARIDSEKELAVEEFARLLLDAIQVFSAQRAKNPTLFDGVMGNHTSWPVLASLHPRFMDEWKKISLKLGKNTGMRLDPRARWNPRDPGTQAAIQLLKFVARLRNERLHYPKQMRTTKDGKRKKESNTDLLFKVAQLDEFSVKSAVKWWEVAEEFLLRSYPELEEENKFRSMVKAKSHVRSPGRVRARVLQRIKGKFLSLAGRHAPLAKKMKIRGIATQREKRDSWDERAAHATLDKLGSGWVA